jgi:hypothetical protein
MPFPRTVIHKHLLQGQSESEQQATTYTARLYAVTCLNTVSITYSKLSSILWHPKVHWCTHDSQPMSHELNSRLLNSFLRPISTPNYMPLRFPTLCYMDFSSLPFVLHALPNHIPRFDHDNNNWREAQIIAVIQFYSALCSFWGTNILFRILGLRVFATARNQVSQINKTTNPKKASWTRPI